jgi:uncharacterized protein DUF6263
LFEQRFAKVCYDGALDQRKVHMMPFPIRLPALLALLFLANFSGCNYFQGSSSDADADLAELEDDDTKELDEESKNSTPAEGELELKLKVGDRFPLTKRVEQRLTQADGQGVSVYRSLTEMLLSLSVEEVRDGNKLLSVRYHRVRYGQDIAGKKVEYASDSPQQTIPPEALAYAGLHENGFSFWIGPDNRVKELVGFADFLQRCVRNVPPQHRQSVLAQLEGTHSENDLANFVDDGIGLLPYSDNPNHPAVAVKVGSAWDLKPRLSERPVPMQINTRCVLKDLTDSSAEISLIGKIAGDVAPVVVRDGNREMRVFVKGGHCSGTCRIDRRTGLPTNSQVNRYLEMTVQMADGSEIQQRKETLTTINSFVDQPGLPQQQASTSYDSGIQQAGHTREAPVSNLRR